jgi:hypothetical protein
MRLVALHAFVALLAAGSAGIANAHPLHTSFTEIRHDPKSGMLMISLRVFVDDFTKASSSFQQRLVSRNPRAALQSPLAAYAIASLTIADAAGKPLTLESCGGKRMGELMWLCFKARVPSQPKSIRVSNRILFGTFKDQINVVQATLGQRKANALFTPGDGVKQLR